MIHPLIYTFKVLFAHFDCETINKFKPRARKEKNETISADMCASVERASVCASLIVICAVDRFEKTAQKKHTYQM